MSQSLIKEIQKHLVQEEMDGWLLYDFHGSNPIVYTVLGISTNHMLSRRFFYWIPQKGEPIKIVSLIEPHALDDLPGVRWTYRGWKELEEKLFSLVGKGLKIAMEYSPNNHLPSASKVDAGIVELLCKTGAEVVSSANVLQRFTSVWTPEQLQSHLEAAEVLEKAVSQAWGFIEQALRSNKKINEYQVQQFILKSIHEEGCETSDWPICAVNAHSADPHYQPEAHTASFIQAGDWILLDLWCKKTSPHAVYADITRVGVAASQPTAKQQEVFTIVKRARDQATSFIREKYEKGISIQGWQVDQVCRSVIEEAGYGEFFIHRTGHNIGEEVHGLGANLDNLETHDDRELLPGTAFSVEPGIYLPQKFGVRLEYDVYLDAKRQILITGGIQEEIHLLNF